MGDGGAAQGQAAEGPTPAQRRFVDRALGSHALLVAGPGSGKTRTLAFAARALVEESGVAADGIIALTFSRSLAETLSRRIPQSKASTVHSFALWHLNRMGAAWGRRIADEWAVENLVLPDLQLGVESAFDDRPTVREVRGFLKALGTAFRDGQEEPPELSAVEARLWQVFVRQRELFRYRLLDELVSDLLRLLERGDDLRPTPTHLLVDEYQDLTPGELRVFQLLAERGCRIVAAGDDRQSIYRFREADENALHHFGRAYRVDLDALSESWRCPRRVCEFAEVIARPLPPLPGFDRPPLVPQPNRGDPGEVCIVTTATPEAEAQWVLAECRRLVRDGTRPQDIMIIPAVMSDYMLADLNQLCADAGDVPFSFYDPRWVNPASDTVALRLLGAGARLLIDEDDHIAWRTIVWATPGLGDDRLTRLLTADQGDYKRNLAYVGDRDGACGRALGAGVRLLERLQGRDECTAREIVELMCGELQLGAIDLGPLQAAVEVLERDHGSPAEWANAVISLSERTLIKPEDRPDDIPVRTVFSAKGLEAPVAFVTSAIEASLTRGGEGDGIRRLYVAVTRPMRALFISAPRGIARSRLGFALETREGGLADVIVRAARELGLEIERR